MQSFVFSLFCRSRAISQNFCEALVSKSTSAKYRTKGMRDLKKARKYRPPEYYEDPNYYGMGPHKKVHSMTDSLTARGFARERENYTPPSNVPEKLYNVCQNVYESKLDENWRSIPLNDAGTKFKLLTKCIDEFGRDIPSSYLCHLKYVGDLEKFFNMPAAGTSPYDALIRDSDKLPPNLHVITDEIVFNPYTDTFFDGKTAFPGRKRIIFTKRGEEFEKVIEWPNV